MGTLLVLITYLKLTIEQVIELLESGHPDIAIKFLKTAKTTIEKDMDDFANRKEA